MVAQGYLGSQLGRTPRPGKCCDEVAVINALVQMTAEQQTALRTAQTLSDLGHSIDAILATGLIPESQREFIRRELQRDANIDLVPARTVVADPNREDWLVPLDRSSWYYWPALRNYLIAIKGWQPAVIRS